MNKTYFDLLYENIIFSNSHGLECRSGGVGGGQEAQKWGETAAVHSVNKHHTTLLMWGANWDLQSYNHTINLTVPQDRV